jgi:hypothetical protein
MHRITYDADRPLEKFARCRCGFITKRYKNMDDVEDEIRKHQADIERIKLQLGTRTPSLKSQRDYFRKMAENEHISPKDRRQWGILADELDARIEDDVTPDNHPSLF